MPEPSEMSYPSAPWYLAGEAWGGLFRTDAPVPLPAGLERFGPSHVAVVGLVRYRSGTLCYDELAIGALARHGLRLGVAVSGMWVNDAASMWGGRRIWGLSKQLAEFEWNGDVVRVSDVDGLVCQLRVSGSEFRHGDFRPWLPLPAFGFGSLGNGLTFIPATMWVRPSRARLSIADWSPRFPFRPSPTPLVGVSALFRLRVPQGQVIAVPVNRSAGRNPDRPVSTGG